MRGWQRKMFKYLCIIILRNICVCVLVSTVHSNSIIFFKLAHRDIFRQSARDQQNGKCFIQLRSLNLQLARNRIIVIYVCSRARLIPRLKSTSKSSSSKMRYFDKRVNDIFSETVAVMEKRKWYNNACTAAWLSDNNHSYRIHHFGFKSSLNSSMTYG